MGVRSRFSASLAETPPVGADGEWLEAAKTEKLGRTRATARDEVGRRLSAS
jgi:hypothetical protein